MSGGNERCYLSEPGQGGGVAVDLRPGQTLLDRFTIRSSLGRGSCGAVYLAFDAIRSKEVALKVVPVASEPAAQQMRREIELNSRVVDYRHVVRVYDVHAAPCGGLVLLLVSMEYADGGSLRQWLLENKDDVQKRRSVGVDLFTQACYGVQALHEMGIVHLDVKPENLLFVAGILKVSDLSLSRYVHDISAGSSSSALNDPQRPRGTPAYMSPEQLAAPHPNDVDCRSDIYSLAIILFEICHSQCRPPFGGSYEQVRDRHLHMPAPRLENAGDNEGRVVAKSLQKNPADRYATVSQMIEDLQGRGQTELALVPEVSAESQAAKRAADLWLRASECVAAHDLSEAGRLCSQVLGICPEHNDAKRMLEEIQRRDQQARQFYAMIERGLGFQSLQELLHLLQEAVGIYPNHPDGRLVQTQLLSLTRQYDEVIHQAAAAINDGQWQVAQANLDRARQINPCSPAITRLCEFVSEVRMQIETTRHSIDAAVEQGQRDKALFLARGLDDYVRRMSRPESLPQEWRTTNEDDDWLLNAYRFARRICADVFGGAR
jgi:serine/threonine protein kinase